MADTDVINNARQTLLRFLRAADKIERIPFSDSLSCENLIEDRITSYTVTRRLECDWLGEMKKCHKWTQTSYKGPVVVIDGVDCWRNGTLSHSLLQVSVRNCCFGHGKCIE